MRAASIRARAEFERGIHRQEVGRDKVSIAMFPIAYTKGTEFRPAPRKDLDAVLHIDRW